MDAVKFSEDSLYQYIEGKCYEVANRKKAYEIQWQRHKECVESVLEFSVSVVTGAHATLDAYMNYSILRRDLHQLIWALDKEEYKLLWRKIVEKGGE